MIRYGASVCRRDIDAGIFELLSIRGDRRPRRLQAGDLFERPKAILFANLFTGSVALYADADAHSNFVKIKPITNLLMRANRTDE